MVKTELGDDKLTPYEKKLLKEAIEDHKKGKLISSDDLLKELENED